MTGWVKIHRSITEWEWWGDATMVKAFLGMLMLCSHAPRKRSGRDLQPGQFLSSRAALALYLGLSEQQIRTVIRRMQASGEITVESSPRQTLITMVNWQSYQSGTDDALIDGVELPSTNCQPTVNQLSTNCQPAINQPSTNRAKKEKERSKEKEIKIEQEWKEDTPPISPPAGGNAPVRARVCKKFIPPTEEEVAAYCRERGNAVSPRNFVDFYAAKGWVVGKSPMKDWKAAVRTWERSSDHHAGWHRDPRTGVVRGISDAAQIAEYRQNGGF